MDESVRFGIVASLKHPQIDYNKVNYSSSPYALQPYHTVTYAECHDNHVLWDKLAICAKEASEVERTNMHKLALSIVLSSQGIAFLHAGTEFLRTKKGVENSFESPDSINAIDWGFKSKNREVVEYVKALIKMRKSHPAFRMTDAKKIAANINFDNGIDIHPGVIAYTINGAAVGDSWKKIFVIFNGNNHKGSSTLPAGKWKLFIQNNEISKKLTVENKIEFDPHSCTILYQ